MGNYIVLRMMERARGLLARGLGVRLPAGKVRIAKECAFEPPCVVKSGVNLKTCVRVGAFTSFDGDAGDCRIRNIKIGRYCSIAKHVDIGLARHPVDWVSSNSRFYFPHFNDWDRFTGKVVESAARGFAEQQMTEIGNDVWMGDHVIVMAGVKIGDGAIIGANAVVTRDVPPYAIVGGVPAKVIKYRFDEATIKELLDLQWWRYDAADFGKLDWSDVHGAIAAMKAKIAAGLKPYEPGWVTWKELLPYTFRRWFHFGIGKGGVRIKFFGVWIVHCGGGRNGF